MLKQVNYSINQQKQILPYPDQAIINLNHKNVSLQPL